MFINMVVLLIKKWFECILGFSYIVLGGILGCGFVKINLFLKENMICMVLGDKNIIVDIVLF